MSDARYISFRKTPQFYKTWGGALMCDLAGGCQLDCKFCWATNKRSRTGTIKTPEEVYDRAVNSSMGVACLTCSEPLLQSEHVIDVVNVFAAHPDGPALIIETNGVSLTPEIAKRIGIHDHIFVRVSVKGVDSLEFFDITGCQPELYQKVFENIRAALPFVNLWCSLITYNKKTNRVKRICREIDPDLAKLLEIETIKEYKNIRR